MRVSPAAVILALLAVAFALLTAWSLRYFGRYQPFADIIRASVPTAGVADLDVQQAIVVGRAHGKKRWRIGVEKIAFLQGRQRVLATAIHDGTLYDGAEKPVATLAAARAEYETPTGALGLSPGSLLRVEGGVRASILAPRLVRLAAETLIWDSVAAVVRCPGRLTATLSNATASLSGEDIVFQTKTGDFSMRRLSGTFRVSTGVLQPMLSRKSLALASGALLLAQATPALAPQTVTYNAGATQWLNINKTIKMTEGVKFTQQDASLQTSAAVATLDDSQNLVSAKSLAPVHLYDSQNDLIGQSGTIDFTRRLATITGSITLVVKPRPASSSSLRSQFKDAATMTCDLMTYDYRRKIGKIPGNLTIRQTVKGKSRVLQADSATYNGNAQTVLLMGNVHGSEPGLGNVKASKATIGIKEGEEYINIPVPTSGQFTVKDEPDETPTTEPPTQNPPPQNPTPEPPRF